jgi:hypothetical protein
VGAAIGTRCSAGTGMSTFGQVFHVERQRMLECPPKNCHFCGNFWTFSQNLFKFWSSWIVTKYTKVHTTSGHYWPEFTIPPRRVGGFSGVGNRFHLRNVGRSMTISRYGTSARCGGRFRETWASLRQAFSISAYHFAAAVATTKPGWCSGL